MVYGQYTKFKGCAYAQRKAECLDAVVNWQQPPQGSLLLLETGYQRNVHYTV